MKKFFVTIVFLSLLACQSRESRLKNNEVFISNLGSEGSLNEVESALKAKLDEQNVRHFINLVKDYNEVLEFTSLTRDFSKMNEEPKYNLAKMGELWSKKKPDFIGTNCRINTFLLLKNNITIKKAPFDAALLFFDIESIKKSNIFSESELEDFCQLFSRVKTEASQDINLHYKKMKEHFSNIRFDKNAKMLSVVIHDNLDGDYLFIGHVGLLVKTGSQYLFVEKLSFDEPYQALKFANENACYNYLFEKYKIYQDENTAIPFIMENDRLIKLEQYTKTASKK